MKEYTTIEGFGNATYEIQKSRFLTYTAHVETEAEAREFVLSIKKKHFDARHNCSAWVLGPDSSLQKYCFLLTQITISGLFCLTKAGILPWHSR